MLYEVITDTDVGLSLRQRLPQPYYEIRRQRKRIARDYDDIAPDIVQTGQNAGQWSRVIRQEIVNDRIPVSLVLRSVAVGIDDDPVHLGRKRCKHVFDQRMSLYRDQPLVTSAESASPAAGIV